MEAISHAGTCLGVLSQEGIVLAAENKNTSKLLEESSQSEKIYKLDSYVYAKLFGNPGAFGACFAEDFSICSLQRSF
jgi:20S proteasome subunit alpha 3